MPVKRYSLASHGQVVLSPHFKVREFRCKDGSDTILIEDQLIVVLEQLFAYFKCSKINITSGYRTPTHDKNVGGRGAGNHCEGKAVDFMAYDAQGKLIPSAKIVLYLEDIGINGIGYRCGGNANSTHMDVNYRENKWFGDERISMTKSIWNIKSGCYSFYDYLNVKRPADVVLQETKAGVKYKIICSSLNVRKKPGVQYEKTGYLKKNAIVTVYEVSGNWGCIGADKWISINPAYARVIK